MPHSKMSARALAFAALLLAACSDSLPLTAPDSPESALLHGVAVRDAAIRRDDSHFTARVRVTRSGEGNAAAPGASLRLTATVPASVMDAPTAETFYVEGGYGSAGEIHFGVYWDAVNPAFGYAGMRAIGDRVELLNTAGQVLSAQPFNAQMAAAGLPGGTLVAAFFPTGEPGVITCPASDPQCGSSAELREASATDAALVGSTREVRRELRRSTQGADSDVDADRSEVVRRYRKVAEDAWRLEEVRHTDHVTTGQGPRVTLTVMQVTYGAWHRNASRDVARAALPRARVGVARTPLAPTGPSSAVAATGSDGAFLESRCAPPAYNVDILRSKSVRALAILYQHGFCGDAGTWDGMRPRISSTFTVARERAFSIATTGRAETQVDTLIQRLRSSTVRSNLVIGHSLGGLLARRLGQRDSALVSGVITISSPHLGALGADIDSEYAADLLAGAVGNICVGDWLCEAITQLLVERNSGRLLHGVPGLVAPVLQDLSTNSAFIRTLNTTRETFLRAGIEVNAGNRWALFRMIGDARSPRTPVVYGQRPAGHHWAESAERVYVTARFLQFLSIFVRFEVAPHGGGVDCGQSGYAGYWTPCTGTDWETSWDIPWYGDYISYLIYQLSTIVIRTMDFIDLTWDWLTTRNADLTDGLVALRSQGYPNSPGTYAPIRVLITPPDAESHAGETASPRVVDRTIDIIRALGMGVQ